MIKLQKNCRPKKNDMYNNGLQEWMQLVKNRWLIIELDITSSQNMIVTL